MNLENDYINLHLIPEEGFKEFKTHNYIVSRLEKLKCKIIKIKTGVIAFFDFNKPNTIAFRAELDGLNIKEETQKDYSSIHDGYMHACGHDGHMSILLGLCDYLSINIPNVNVCCIFQPSEEKYGGALQIIENEAYKELNIKEIYGLHLWPLLKEGTIYSKSGVLMASSTEIDINVKGKSSHMANKKDGINALKIAFDVLEQIKKYEHGVVFNCGKINSMGTRNSVCSDVRLECSVRSFSVTQKFYFFQKLDEICKQIAHETGSNIFIDAKRCIPAVTNDYMLYSKHKKYINEVIDPVYQAEDFSEYNQNTKGLFFFLGVGDAKPLHSSDFSFNLKNLSVGLELFINILNNSC